MKAALIEQWIRDTAPAVVTLAVALLLYQGVRRWTRLFAKRGQLSRTMALRLRLTARWLLAGGTTLIVLQQLGFFDEAWALLSAVVAALAVAFVASWSVLSNVSCALFLLVYRPFRVGDYVEVVEPSGDVGARGKVVDLNLFYTTLLESGSAVIRIPNNVFVQKYSRVRREGRPPDPARDSVGPFFTVPPGTLIAEQTAEPQGRK